MALPTLTPEQRQEALKKAADAKKAAGVNVKSTTGAGSTPKSVDATLSEIAAKAYA